MADALWVRRARTADERAWVELYCSVAAELDWIGGEPPFEAGRVEASFQARARSRPGGLWVVEQSQSEVLGWFDLRRTEEDWMYLGMGVAHRQRGLGIGRELLRVADYVTAHAGARGIQLDVFEHNERGRRLYISTGFTDVGTETEMLRKDGRVFRSREMRKNRTVLDETARRVVELLDDGQTVRLELPGND